MEKVHDQQKKLSILSTAEINKLVGGKFSDFDVMDSFDELAEQDVQLQNRDKMLALLKLAWRSPECHDWFAYGEILSVLMQDVVKQENGKDFLFWALTQVAFDARHVGGYLGFDTYWDYARGLLYQGHGSVFTRFLDALQAKTVLPENCLRTLIEDAARLGAPNLAKDLNALAKKRYGEKWQPVLINSLLPQTNAPEPSPVIDEEVQASILASLAESSLADSGEDIESKFFLTSDKAFTQITKNADTQTLMLMVPDMIWFIFRFWDVNCEDCLIPLKALEILANVMPELSILGDLLNNDGKEVFIFESFGKTAGFTFNSVKSFAVGPEYNVYLRTQAAKALMEISQEAPRYRSRVVKIIEELITTRLEDPEEDEILCSYLVADLLDTDLVELKPALPRAFQENRVDPKVVGLESFSGKWSLPAIKPTSGTNKNTILLKCMRCERTRSHPYNMIFFDINSRGRSPSFTAFEIILDHPVVCPICGAKETYLVDIKSILRLVPPAFFTEEEKSISSLDESVYILFSERLYLDGLSPYLFSILRKKVIEAGWDTLDHLERGEYARVTGKFQESLAAFRRFHEDHPNSQRGTLALAMAEHDYGDRAQSKTYYQHALSLENEGVISGLDNPRVKTAIQGLKALDQGENSPYLYPVNKYQQTLLGEGSKKKRNRRRH